MMRWCLLGVLFFSSTVQAFELKVEKVANNVYALVGEIGPRTPQNHGLNNTLGFVITAEGVVLVGSGATPAGAKLIEQAVASVTKFPISQLINIGVQDHHWLGNSYFSEKKIPIKALKRTVDNQQKQVQHHISRLQQQVGDEAKTVVPFFADDVVEADSEVFAFGGQRFELVWPGDGHFAGDAVLWLPEQGVIFSGDFVFHERMLGVHSTTPLVKWQQSFHIITKLNTNIVIPGHGHPGDLTQSETETGNYLDWLVAEVKKALADWQELGETVEQLSDAPAFEHLKLFDSWHKRNIHQTYMQLEAASQ